MTRKIALFPLMLIVMLSVGACDTAEERAEQHYQNALGLIEEGDVSRAQVELRNVFQLNPLHREARRLFALNHDALGNTRETLRAYLFLVEQFPDDFDALLRMAELSADAGAWNETERYGRRAAELDPAPLRVRIISNSLDYRQAIEDSDTARRGQVADEALALTIEAPQNGLVRRILVDWFAFQGRERDALEHLDIAIAADPEDMSIYGMRLVLLERLGETPELERQLKAMVTQFPDDQEVKQRLLRWYLSRGEAEAAEDFLRELSATSEGDDQLSAQVSLVQFIKQTKGDEAALAELELIIADVDSPAMFKSIRAGIEFDLGDRENSIAAMQELVDAGEPSDETRRFKVILAQMQLRTGNSVGARALVEEVLSEDPGQVEAIKIKSDMLIDGDQAEQAIALLRQALDQEPDNASIMTLTARAHERAGNRELMGEMLALAAEASQNAPAESIRLAKFLISREQFAPAEQALIDSLRRAPTQLELLAELGQLYVRMEKIGDAQAIENRLRSFETDRGTAIADRLKLAILRSQNRNADIVAMVEGLASASGDASQATYALMRTHLANDDLDEARRVLLDGLEKDPENLQLLFSKGVLSGIDGDGEEARAIFRDVLDSEPRAVNVWLALVRSLQSEGNVDGALAAVDEAIEAVPNSGNLRWAKAGYLERNGDIAGAIEIYEALYDASSSSIIAANNLASLLSSYSDDAETVERAYAIARRLRGIEQPAFQDTYGWIAFQRGDLDDALTHLEPAAAGLAGDPLVQYHLARTYEALENHAQAAKFYGQVLEITDNAPSGPMSDTVARLEAAKTAASGE